MEHDKPPPSRVPAAGDGPAADASRAGGDTLASFVGVPIGLPASELASLLASAAAASPLDASAVPPSGTTMAAQVPLTQSPDWHWAFVVHGPSPFA